MANRVLALERPREPLSILPREPRAPGPGEVRLRVEACALGQLDWNLLTLDAPPRLPLVPGVEAVGVVDAAGEGVSLAPGVRVLVTPLASSCGACAACAAGDARWCPSATLVGRDLDGALATHVTLPAQHLVPAPAVPVAQAACLGGSAWAAVGAVREAHLAAGGNLGVLGVGGVGHLVLQVAQAHGLSVFADDADSHRRALAVSLGAQPWPGPGSLDAAVVCTPSAQALQRALKAVRAGGVVVAVGTSLTGRIDLPLADVVARGVTVVGSALGTHDDAKAALALAQQGALVPQVEVVPLNDAVSRLWQLRDGGFVGRLVFTP